MNENINLYEILKGHEGETFYCLLTGKNFKLHSVTEKYIALDDDGFNVSIYGTFFNGGECIIFPSKDQRDWIKWDEENNHKTFKTWSDIEKQENRICSIFHGIGDAVDYKFRPIEKSAFALLKIHQLIEAGYGGNVTNEEWVNSDENNLIYVPFYNPIEKEFQSFGIFGLHRKSLIAFHTHKQIKEFLSKPENVQLLKDYFMI